MDTLEKNRKAFAEQSKGFSREGDTYADEADLKWMLADLPLSGDEAVLDVATGTGEFARALAPNVSSVIGIDATDAMLETGERFVQEAEIPNITFRKGVVQDLPFERESFDIVSSRYAFHHFADPKPVIAEMVRVCRTGGHLIIVDIVVPVVERAAEYNYYEWLCDQSHTRCLAPTEFQSLFQLLGAEVVSARSRQYEEPVVEWMDFSLTEKEHREKILGALADELNGGTITGMSPLERDSVLYFKQQDISVVGRKKAP